MPLRTTMAYPYDAAGRRTGKGTISVWNCNIDLPNGFQLTNEYVLGQGGEQVSELDGSGNWMHTNVYVGGQLLATLDPVAGHSYDHPAVHYQLADWLGTRRMQVSPIGTLEETCQSLPFGDEMNCVPTAAATSDDATEHHFTGKERDAETGNDYFLARYYGSSTGRFLSPDPSGLYYADPTNPQSLNLYSYVLNSPLMFIDPSGLDPHCTGYTVTQSSGSSDSGEPTDSDSCTAAGGTWGDFTPGQTPSTSSSVDVVDNSEFFDYARSLISSGVGIYSSAPVDGMADNPMAQALFHGRGAPNNAGHIAGCFAKGLVAGVATAAAVGVVAAIAAPVVGTAAVTAGLGALAITGAVALGVTSGLDISNHNWAGLAYNAGNVLGGAATGFAGGARVATAIEPNATPGWSPSSWQAQAYDSSKGSVWQWLGTGPTHASAGLATTGGSFLGSLFGGCGN